MTQQILNGIDEASKNIGSTWPLYSFVASNPLSGYENTAFLEAVASAKLNNGSQVFPSAEQYRHAWKQGEIDPTVLTSLLSENDLSEKPEYYLELLAEQQATDQLNDSQQLDRIMAKWLAVFLDEGIAEWSMPYKTEGFYTAWRHLVIYDAETDFRSLKQIPKTSLEALEVLIRKNNVVNITSLFTHHLTALPGWSGYIKHRVASNSEWHKEFPIQLIDYLAVRLWTADRLNVAILPEDHSKIGVADVLKIQYVWLKAWETTWQNGLVKTLRSVSIEKADEDKAITPDAQMVFCIDTRSELIRRHIEATGNYETHGYAGFFGIAMDYEGLEDGIIRKSCPPIVASSYHVSEGPAKRKEKAFTTLQAKNRRAKFWDYFLWRMKNLLPSAFGYVEGSGVFYAFALMKRSVLSVNFYQRKQEKDTRKESLSEPNMHKAIDEGVLLKHIPLDEKVNIVKSAFDLMGWKRFAPLILFVGHGSHSANNPFGSSLDCGACAASPGRHNARMLAKLANMPAVRKTLSEKHSIEIPANTIFVAAEHNTTTDAIVLFDSEIPNSHLLALQELMENLVRAQQSATADRLGINRQSVRASQQKASTWSETRPEWGLAKNAGFIVGPRSLTKSTNLNSRCFLHSYDWKLDPNGKALEGIMQGPMVVTQWINNHYYFSTVDNKNYGGGDKTTHNITGKFGVVQGNGGDLKVGLPLQSLYQSDSELYHQPLRLSVTIQAPVQRVTEILLNNAKLKSLLDNEWIYLLVMDPLQHNEIFRYGKSLRWESTEGRETISIQPQQTKAQVLA